MKPLEGTSAKRPSITVFPSSKYPKQRTIVVLGVERGGTSMVAGMVRALGVDLGEQAGRNHEDPKFLTDDKDKLLERIEEYNSKKDLWGFKVPKASLMLDFYDKHLRNPYYILVFRNIEATVDSWCSRGPNDPMATALHAMKYYGAVLNFLEEAKKPLLFANYERACTEPKVFAAELAEFLGVEADDESINRASSIVSGEGGGYLDLPEYYFHIDVLNAQTWPSINLHHDLDNSSAQNLALSEKKVSEMIVVKPEGEFFPKEFYLGFTLDTHDSDFLEKSGLRIYMDFVGKFFPGHAFRPVIKNGRNLLHISNNGNLSRIALGSLQNGFTWGIDFLQCYSIESNVPPESKDSSLPKRLMRKIKSITFS